MKKKTRRIVIIVTAILAVLSCFAIAFAQEKPNIDELQPKLEEIKEQRNIPGMSAPTSKEENPEITVLPREANEDDIAVMLYYGTLDEIEEFASEYGKSLTAVSASGTVVERDDETFTVDILGNKFAFLGSADLGSNYSWYIAW